MKVRVCVRTRPTQSFAQDNLAIDTEHATIRVKHVEADTGPSTAPNNRQNAFSFKFDYVFHNASQAAVYDLYARDCVQGVVNGVNGSIMSYGQTGSGKTFTMIGDAQSYEHRGIAPRAISQLFAEIGSRVETEYMVSCTFIEIYNERIYDLLGDLNSMGNAADYTIAEERDGRGVFVRGVAEVEVPDESSALNLLFSGGLSRTVASHKLNKRSNRSHSIFTLYVQQRQRSGVSERIAHSKLHLIDLAGSERLKKTMDSVDGSMGDDVTRKESMAINQSLTFLEQCVVALGRKGSHVPYRQSKLTNIMKDCLGANCNTVMIACIWGEASHLEETVSTLRLASRMMRVTNETSAVETVDTAVLLKKQEKIIAALKQELLMHDALVERTGVVYDPYTPEQQAEVSDLVERYVEAAERDEEGVLSIRSYRQMLEICRQFKKKLLVARAGRSASRGALGDASRGLGATAEAKGLEAAAAAAFGDARTGRQGFSLDTNRGFALGEARADNRPANGIEAAPTFAPRGGAAPGDSLDRAASPSTPAQRRLHAGAATGARSLVMEAGFDPEEAALIETFVQENDRGRQLFADFGACKAALRDLKARMRQLSLAVNEAKGGIDQYTAALEAKKQARAMAGTGAGAGAAGKDKAKAKGGAGDIVDEEEFRAAKQLKDAKLAYRNNLEQLQKLQASAEAHSQDLQDLRERLHAGLRRWQQSGGSPSPQSKRLMASLGGDGGDDELDDQEAFDRLETERVMANDPDSLAFFTAQKTMRANLTQSGSAIRMLQRNRRYG